MIKDCYLLWNFGDVFLVTKCVLSNVDLLLSASESLWIGFSWLHFLHLLWLPFQSDHLWHSSKIRFHWRSQSLFLHKLFGLRFNNKLFGWCFDRLFYSLCLFRSLLGTYLTDERN